MFPTVFEVLKIHFEPGCPNKEPFSNRLPKSYLEGRSTILFMFPSVFKYLKMHFTQVSPTNGLFPADSKNRI